MNQQAIIFDFNGTLFFDEPYHKLAWDTFSLKYRDKLISEEEATQLFGKHNIDVLKMLFPNFDISLADSYSKEKEQIYRDICLAQSHGVHLVSGATALLDKCKQLNIPINICSAAIIENIDFYFEYFNLGKWFNYGSVVCDDNTLPNKAAMYLKAAQNINTSINNCTIIEDSLTGLQGAFQAGCPDIVYIQSDPNKASSPFPKASIIIHDYDEFSTYYFTNKKTK